jgi:hypothetical protein
MNRIAEEQRRRNDQSRGRWDLFREHREQVTRLLEDAAPSEEGSLCILGAGNSNDLDLNALLRRYREIHLVDVDSDALQFGVTSQGCAGASNILLHGDVDLTAIADHLARGTPDDPLNDAELDECLRVSSTDRLAGLPAPFDTVASVCTLSQLLGATVVSLGENHPRYVEMTMHLRNRHLKLLLDLLRPGGTAVFVLDFVSSATCPELPQVLKSHIYDKAVQLVSQQNFFTGVNPFVIRHRFETDSELAPYVENAEMTNPWLWDLGPRVYLVCAVVVRKKDG